MQYMLLIYEPESAFSSLSDDERNAMLGEYFAFTNAIRESGHYRAGDALQPVGTATTVRVKEGRTLLTDGPFAETREQLGGYYLVEAKDIDEACAIAARIPASRSGSIEVRPVMVFDAAPT
ncbi:MAG: YciI family protein [Myxococcota bacterium]|nr:YciI family protein [Myxococcota bacterium]